jgi:hypothetical protein
MNKMKTSDFPAESRNAWHMALVTILYELNPRLETILVDKQMYSLPPTYLLTSIFII